MGKQKRAQKVVEATSAKKGRPMDALTLLGKYRRPGRSLDDFLREKHREIDEEERNWEEAHPSLRASSIE